MLPFEKREKTPYWVWLLALTIRAGISFQAEPDHGRVFAAALRPPTSSFRSAERIARPNRAVCCD
jgi:hypothetical protein